MTVRGFLKSLTATSESKAHSTLNSRKFMVYISVAVLTTIACYVLVACLGIYSSTIVEKGLEVLQNVAIAYFTVNVAEKVVDAYNNGKQQTEGEV